MADPTPSEEDRLSTAARLEELKRQYVSAENDRRRHIEEVAVKLRKQRTIISRLKREREKLKESLAEETVPFAQTGTLSATGSTVHANRLKSLQKEHKKLQTVREQMIEKLGEYSQLRKVLDLQVAEERSRLGELKREKRTDIAIQRQIDVLENRLNKATVRFNRSLTENRTLREKIDSLRRERGVYDEIYTKLETKLESLQEVITQVIDDSNESYNLREAFKKQLADLRAEVKKETEAFDQEWRELNRLIEQDKKLRELLSIRDTDQGQTGTALATAMRASIVNRDRPRGSGSAMGRSFTEDRILSYEEAFQRIQEVTGIETVQELVERFIEGEDKNFAAFNELNELNSLMEAKQVQIDQKKEEIEDLSRKQEEKQSESSNKMRKLETDRTEALEEIAKTKARIEEQQKQLSIVITDLKQYLQRVFDAKCAQAKEKGQERQLRVVYHLDEEITADSILKMFGVVEQDLNDLILRTGAGVDDRPMSGPRLSELRSGTSSRMGGASLSVSIAPPTSISIDDLSDEELDFGEEGRQADKPLTRKELRERSMRRM